MGLSYGLFGGREGGDVFGEGFGASEHTTNSLGRGCARHGSCADGSSKRFRRGGRVSRRDSVDLDVGADADILVERHGVWTFQIQIGNFLRSNW